MSGQPRKIETSEAAEGSASTGVCVPKPRRSRGAGDAPAPAISLPVIRQATERGGGPGKMRSSRSGRWRAIVLVAVHVVIALHVLQWWLTGMTLSPVEPSESMYTLELGRVNAGFVFFVLAILSTLVLGRFLCGWGCHVVALQDACSWLMLKMGIRPRPFRSRLMILFPLGLALYMFVWPTFRRELLHPIVTSVGLEWPVWLSEPQPFPGFENALMTTDFWATFPPWYVAIPFLFVCGFAIVYFMGSKAFCSFGCPYGGFFGVADRIAPGRILVNDDCNQCGHCTANCTSNVRVHEEVRDFGMVVDPGCMKCMDCVSVCPNNALRFGFARPAVLAKPRSAEAAERRRTKARHYDLTLREEIWVCALMLVLIVSFRGMFDMVPLLMAMALAALGAFFAWKLWRMTREANVRLVQWQVRSRGRTTRAGWIFASIAVLWLGLAAWGGAVGFHHWRANVESERITTSLQRAIADPASVSASERAHAQAASLALARSDSFEAGGFGWGHNPARLTQMAWMAGVAGDWPRVEQALARGISKLDGSSRPSDELILLHASAMERRGATRAEVRTRLAADARERPYLLQVRLTLARMALEDRDATSALAYASGVVGDLAPREGRQSPLAHEQAKTLVAACEILLYLGRASDAAAALEASVKTTPSDASLRQALATALLLSGAPERALAEMEQAAMLAPNDPGVLLRLAELVGALGDAPRAQELRARAERIQRAGPG
ncbi:MAG: hypothetical protein SFZ23_04530 [Planctomycetota bacterium]|nr:hypothetical protein [Planctomycetota bacterium]